MRRWKFAEIRGLAQKILFRSFSYTHSNPFAT